MASLTKIMTALVVVDETRPREKVRITKDALRYSGSGVGVLPKGKKVPVDGLLAGLLLPSGNDAAIALADHVSGSERRFVQTMNRRAKKLGLRCTRFASAHGLEPGNRSLRRGPGRDVTHGDGRAADRADRAQQAGRRPSSRSRAGGCTSTRRTRCCACATAGTIGLKTGSTDEAGHCFVGVVRRGKRQLGVVLMHSPNTGAQAKQLFDAAFRAGRA